jgi:hypothetical protein
MEAPVFKHAVALLVSIFVTTGSYGSAAPELQVDNAVSQCVDIRLGEPVQRAGNYFVDARFLARQELSQCGCTSKVMSYSVEDEHSTIIMYRRFTVESNAAKTLKLGRVGKGSQQQKLMMRIGCAGPQ